VTVDIVNEVLGSWRAIQAEEARLDQQFGTKRPRWRWLASRPAKARAAAKNIHREQLEQSLLERRQDSLLKMVAVLAYGRDRSMTSFARILARHRKRDASKEECVQTIMESLPRAAQWIDRALGKLAREGLTLEII
jgi:hypothetical protein